MAGHRSIPPEIEAFDPTDCHNPWRLYNGCFVPEWLARRSTTEISYGAKLCFGRLHRFAGQKGVCNPSHTELAEEVGCQRRQAQRFLDELVALKLIVYQSGKEAGRPGHIRFPARHPWAVDGATESTTTNETMVCQDGRTHLRLDGHTGASGWTHPPEAPYMEHVRGTSESVKESEERDMPPNESAAPVPVAPNGKAADNGKTIDWNEAMALLRQWAPQIGFLTKKKGDPPYGFYGRLLKLYGREIPESVFRTFYAGGRRVEDVLAQYDKPVTPEQYFAKACEAEQARRAAQPVTGTSIQDDSLEAQMERTKAKLMATGRVDEHGYLIPRKDRR